jgi:hypothetical protein
LTLNSSLTAGQVELKNKGGSSMSIMLKDFVFENQSGLTVVVYLEAPIGSQVATHEVEPSKKETFHPGVSDVNSVKVRVEIKDDLGGPHKAAASLTVSGGYISALTSEYQVASVKGTMQISY